jgi:DNA modification methylase
MPRKVEEVSTDHIQFLPVDTLVPYARNARTHSPEQVAQIAGSIREFGFTNPVLIDASHNIIAGHGRVLGARQLGMDAVPTLTVGPDWSDAKKRAYLLADNKLALNAGWDFDLLRGELQDLDTGEIDLSLTGFSSEELEQMLTWAPENEGLTDPDEVPELAEEAITQPGDVWLLGRHRLMCGDSTVATSVETLLSGVKPHLMVTDPPYGVEYDPEWRSAVNNDGPESRRATGKVLNDDRADWRDAWALFPGDVAYVWHAGVFSPAVAESLVACAFEMRALIVWAKSKHTFGRGHYHHMHEPCWYAVRKAGTGHWSGDRKQTTLWQIDTNRSNDTGHSTQKPVECMKRPIENNSNPGQAVYEPFSGSGTTIIAGEMTGRCIYAMELSPQYVDVAVKRWQAFTGKRATLESSGVEFGS